MDRYEKYKDSGIEWIGEIPDSWDIKKLKYEVTVNPNKKNIDKNSMDLVCFLPMEKVSEDGEINCSIKKPIAELYSGFTFFQKGDVIVAKITPCFENGKGAILNDLETDIGFGSTEFHVLRAKEGIINKYLYYITKSEMFMKVGEAFMSGAAGQKRVPTDFIIDFPLVIPSFSEQEIIVTYLDRKTAEIDNLIDQKERLIDLYEEEKTAIINQAVTKGITPNVKLKDSGIDWLGGIPEGWKVKKLKYEGNFINGFSFNSSDFSSSGIRVLKISNIQHMRIDWSDASFIQEVFYEKKKSFRVYKGDLVFALTRPIISTGIKAALIEMDEKILLNQRNSIFRTAGSINIKWIYYMLLSKQFISEFDKRIDKTGQQPNISSNDIGDITIPVISYVEQTEIIKFIEQEIMQINAKITKTKKIIALQKEYRTALISEVVTGKIKVTDEEVSCF
ncbi:MAG: restriction endonuclease subunit S [Pseudomonadota bacterium]